MAIWQIIKDGDPISGVFDDEQTVHPWEEGFTTDHVKAHCEELGAGYEYSYMGASGHEVPPEEPVAEE